MTENTDWIPPWTQEQALEFLAETTARGTSQVLADIKQWDTLLWLARIGAKNIPTFAGPGNKLPTAGGAAGDSETAHGRAELGAIPARDPSRIVQITIAPAGWEPGAP